MIVPADFHTPISPARRFLLEWDYNDDYCDRIDVALNLARDYDTLVRLLEGRPVDPARVNTAELEKASRASLVQLVRHVDLLIEERAA